MIKSMGKWLRNWDLMMIFLISLMGSARKLRGTAMINMNNNMKKLKIKMSNKIWKEQGMIMKIKDMMMILRMFQSKLESLAKTNWKIC